MKTQRIDIDNNGVIIPAVLWGEPSDRLLLSVHGVAASKTDPTIALAAEKASDKGFCTLSFDLPEHGDRAGITDYGCKPWNGKSDILAVYRRAKTIARNISFFSCSLGAYFTMLALPELEAEKLLLLSPVLNMEYLIDGMMAAAGVTPSRLEAEGIIPVPGSQELDWKFFCYAKEHSIKYDRAISMAILRGEGDTLCTYEDTADIARFYGAQLTVLKGGEHWFHTPEQMAALGEWLEKNI